jgi:membrane protein DedA with SNARE-associated domain
LPDALISLIPDYGPWIIFGIVALESVGVPLPGETILIAAALLAATTHEIGIEFVVLAAAAGAVAGGGIGYTVGRKLGLPLLRKYGRYIHLDEDRLLIGRYLFFQHGGAVVFFGRFVPVLRMFAALLAGLNAMPPGRFIFCNVMGGLCWACLFGLGTYAVGSEIYKISGILSVVLLCLLIASGFIFSLGIRKYEIALLRRAKEVLVD